MSQTTLATPPLEERLVDLLRARARRGVTTLHPRKDLPVLLPEATWPAIRAAIRRLILERRVVAVERPGGVREYSVLDGACPTCGSRVR